MASRCHRVDAIGYLVSHQSGNDETVYTVKIYNQDLFDRLPHAFLFDTDNTLYAYDPAHNAALQAVKEKVVSTLSISGQDFDKAFKEARNQVKSRLLHTASSHSRLLYLLPAFLISVFK